MRLGQNLLVLIKKKRVYADLFSTADCALSHFVLFIYFFFIEDASLRQAVSKCLKTFEKVSVSEPNNMLSFSTLAYQFIHTHSQTTCIIIGNGVADFPADCGRE